MNSVDVLGGILRSGLTRQPDRIKYLSECLDLTMTMINEKFAGIAPSTSTPIKALGEVLNLILSHVSSSIDSQMSVTQKPWASRYFERNPAAQARMLEAGWCPSDIERTSELYQGLTTQHFISYLKSSEPRRNHASCSRQRCRAAQIISSEYKLSHARGECEGTCTEIKVGLAGFSWTSEPFPVLRVKGADRELGGMTISYEPYRKDQPYIAISHVSLRELE